MEVGRAQVDTGKGKDTELAIHTPTQTRQPKKRFIGRRAAVELAQKTGDSNRSVEESSAIRGSFAPCPLHGQTPYIEFLVSFPA